MAFFKQHEIRELGLFYVHTFILSLASVILPFFTMYFLGLGFSMLQITLMTAVYSVTMFVFEVPTGAFADNHSRKKSTLLGLFTVGLCISLMPLTHTYLLILFLWVIAGIGGTFISGAYDSWVVDNLENHEHLKSEFFIKTQVVGSIGFVISPLLAMLIVSQWSMSALWFVWGGGVLLSALILIAYPEHYNPSHTNHNKRLIDTTKKGVHYIKHHKTIRALIFGSVLFYLMSASSDGIQPLLTDLGLPVLSLGLVYSIISLIGILSPFASKILEKTTLKKALVLSSLLSSLFFFLILFLTPPLYLPAIILLGAGRTLHFFRAPYVEKALHHFLHKETRSTVMSLYSMLTMMLGAIVAVIAGWAMDLVSPQFVIGMSGVFSLASVYYYNKLKDHPLLSTEHHPLLSERNH